MENNDNTQSTPQDLSSPPITEPNSSPPQIEQIEIIPQSKHSGPSTNFQDKPRKVYSTSKQNYFDSRYNTSSSYHHNQYNPHFSSSNSSHSHRTNSISYYRSSNKKNSIEINRGGNYNNYLTSKKKKIDLNSDSHIGKLNPPSLKGKNHNQLIFIHRYDKCSDFTNYQSFLTLNLKFLKQNYKMKGGNEEELPNEVNSSNHIGNTQNNNPLWNYSQSSNMNPLNYMMNVMTPQNANRMMQQNSNNYQMNLLYSLKAMMMSGNNSNKNNISLIHYLNQLQLQLQQQQKMFNAMNNDNSCASTSKTDSNIQNILSLWKTENFVKPYIPVVTYAKSKSMIHNTMSLGNRQMNYPSSNPVSQFSTDFMDNNNSYRPYPMVTDEKTIQENLKTGRYLTGVIRMNKCHTHGYITVPGLDNDILIRGNRSLNQSINLDEVIVELFPIESWKPLVNKKIRKISYYNNNEEQMVREKDNFPNEYNTDIEGDDTNGKVKEELPLDGEYKETFATKEERLKYINKVYNLRPEGRIVKITKSPNSEKEQIARIEIEKSLVFACPIDDTIPKIFIKAKKQKRNDYNKKNDSNNDSQFKNKYYLVKITGWAMNYKCPKGTIVNEIGMSGNIEVESEVLLRLYDIDYTDEFPKDAINQLNTTISSLKIDEEFIKANNRLDLRDDIIFTVDPESSKDLDDAISVKLIDEEKGLLEVGVHIADPSFYVTKDSLLDKEAIHRATTVYLVQKNVPMLPRILSEDICSLMPNQDRLAVSCIFRIYIATGALDENFKPTFSLSVINSKAKWNYDLVQKIIDDKKSVKYEDLTEENGIKPKTKEIFDKMVESVGLLQKLTSLVRKQRFESGSLMIKNDKIKFELDKEKIPIKFSLEEKHESHHLIEELMLIANKLCAEFLYENIKEYSLIRRHPYLNDNKFSEIQRYLISNKISVDYEDPQELNKMLMNLEEKNINKFLCIQHKLKMFMLRAEYVISHFFELEELKHCALNFDLYTHFTSPIRRYPDLIVHRQIKSVLDLQKQKITKDDIKTYFSCYEKLMDHFNEKYNNSKQISQKSQRIFQCICLKNNAKEKYQALVMDISGKSNKRISNNDIISVALFIPELNLELEWKREDNANNIITINKNDSEISIDYKTEDNKVGNKIIRTFDAIDVKLSFVDSIPIDVKCTFELK